jgi:hypothetical protein
MDDDRHTDEASAEELLKRALVDSDAAAAVALQVRGLPLSQTVTVIFHGRRDLATVQTYVAPGGRAAGTSVSAADLLRVPCDLDLAEAADRDEAERLYAEQAASLRDALIGAETMLDVWRDALDDVAGGALEVNRSIALDVELPAHRLLPVALVDREHQIVVAPVCGARTLARGTPPLGIACAQQDVARVYPLPEDPERCLDDFLTVASEHAHGMAERLDHQEASVQRFLELNGDGPPAG